MIGCMNNFFAYKSLNNFYRNVDAIGLLQPNDIFLRGKILTIDEAIIATGNKRF